MFAASPLIQNQQLGLRGNDALAKAHSSSAMARSVPCCSSSFEQPSKSVSRGVMNQPISHLRGSVVSWLKAQPPHRSRGKLLTTRSSNSTQQATMTRTSASSSTLTKEVDLSEGDLSTVPQDDSASPSNSIVHDARSSLSKSTTSSSGDIASWPKPEVQFVSSEGGWQTVRGTLMLPVHADDVYAILTDYGGSAQIFQNISASQLVVSESGSAELVQECGWSFLAFRGSFQVAMSVHEDPASRAVTFDLARSSFMKGFKGKWSVKLLTQEECEASQQLQMHAQAQHSHGQHSEHAAASHTAANGLHLHAQGAPSVQQVPGQGPVGCVVEHTLSIQPSVPIPPAVAPFTKPIFERQVRNILEDLRAGVQAGRGQAING